MAEGLKNLRHVFCRDYLEDVTVDSPARHCGLDPQSPSYVSDLGTSDLWGSERGSV